MWGVLWNKARAMWMIAMAGASEDAGFIVATVRRVDREDGTTTFDVQGVFEGDPGPLGAATSGMARAFMQATDSENQP